MDSFEFATIVNDSGVKFFCTNLSEIDWFLRELKSFVPSYRLHEERKDVNGERYFVVVDRLSNQDNAILWWLFRQLLSRGWEPFSMFGNLQSSALTPEFHLRRKKA